MDSTPSCRLRQNSSVSLAPGKRQLNPTIAISAGERSLSGRTRRRRARRRQTIGRGGSGLFIIVGKAVQAVDWRNPNSDKASHGWVEVNPPPDFIFTHRTPSLSILYL